MHLSDLSVLVSTIGDWVSQLFETGAGPGIQLKNWIVERFGQSGLLTACIIAAGLAIYLALQILKMIIAIIKYLVIPAVVLAFLATLFMPVSFVSALGVTATICSVFLLFKG